MTRFVLYKGENLQVRIHLIPDPTEGFKHNHSNNFYSYCFNGSYTHRIWEVTENKDLKEVDKGEDKYYEYERKKDGIERKLGDEKEPKTGKIICKDTHPHEAGKAYFIERRALHTVEKDQN
jgi:hypothetical protein